ncbi:MAG: YciI family protein [Devosia sp.]
MQYLCIVYANTDNDTVIELGGRSIKDECIEQDLELFAAGKLVMASPLQGPETGVSLRYRNGVASRTDGPYAETKEWIAGFMVIEAATLDEALAIASEGPLEGMADLEIRPLLDQQHSKTGQDRSVFFARRA